jgi:hypothetical protein
MKTLISALCVATLSLGTMAATIAPTQAASMYGDHQNWKFYKHGDHAYLNGHMGDRHYRYGWRFYNGYYFPPAAFIIGGLIFGSILGAIIANQHH